MPKAEHKKMSEFTSAVPGASPAAPAITKVHPLPDDQVSKVLPFDEDDPKAAVAPEAGKAPVSGDEKKEKRKTFDPDSEFFRNWDIFTTVLLIFTAVVTPFEARG